MAGEPDPAVEDGVIAERKNVKIKFSEDYYRVLQMCSTDNGRDQAMRI